MICLSDFKNYMPPLPTPTLKGLWVHINDIIDISDPYGVYFNGISNGTIRFYEPGNYRFHTNIP